MPAADADGRLRLVPFQPRHLRALAMSAAERAVIGGFDLERCIARWPAGPAVSALRHDRVLGCAGLIPMGQDAIGWAVLSEALRARPAGLHRAAVRTLAAFAPRFRRIRATAAQSHAAGHRWLRALGFRPVRALPHYGPDGETFMEYER